MREAVDALIDSEQAELPGDGKDSDVEDEGAGE